MGNVDVFLVGDWENPIAPRRANPYHSGLISLVS